MNLELKSLTISVPNLSGAILKRPTTSLHRIKKRNEERWGDGDSPIFTNRKEKLRQRLQEANNLPKEVERIQTTEVGWQRLFVSLYVESCGQEWLPKLNQDLAEKLFGARGERWNPSRRRQATQLFFERFDKLPALPFLSSRLREAYREESKNPIGMVAVWGNHRATIFQVDGPQKVAEAVVSGESLAALMTRHAIPQKGQFAEKLRQVYLLETLSNCSFGSEPSVLSEIEREKHQPAIDSLRLGAAALRILIERVEIEGRKQWPDAWRDWILKLGCDPRMGRHSADGTNWWGWATESQWRLAVQGIIGLSLQFFFDFLDGTVTASQWEERRDFLQELFDSGKIRDARLALNSDSMRRLPAKMRDRWNTASLRSTTKDTCIIALHCTDDVYLLEGTHTYGLRAFQFGFPIKGFWERGQQTYADSQLRISPKECQIFVRHSGPWISKFKNELRKKFHLEWS
jgi:hypothetical protein